MFDYFKHPDFAYDGELVIFVQCGVLQLLI